jgi:hypothetical protein
MERKWVWGTNIHGVGKNTDGWQGKKMLELKALN